MPVTLKSSGGGSVTMDVPSTASTYTLTLPAATGTVLQTGTTVTVAQGGTGLATLTANNVVLGNGTGTPNFVAPGTSGNVLVSNGTTWTSAAPTGGAINFQSFTSSGTWTKPSGYSANSQVHIQCWGGGASGAIGATTSGSGGGGYNERWLTLSQMGATETITVGAGGAALSSAGNGNAGGTTSAGSLVFAYGGGGGQGGGGAGETRVGGGGGGQLSTGGAGNNSGVISLPGSPYIVTRYDVNNDANVYQGSGTIYNTSTLSVNFWNAYMHGGAGAGSGTGWVAGSSVWGGGGGGSTNNTTAGTSKYAGNGGAGAGSNASAGSQPGGGGGGAQGGTSGAGGAGQVYITVFPA